MPYGASSQAAAERCDTVVHGHKMQVAIAHSKADWLRQIWQRHSTHPDG